MDIERIGWNEFAIVLLLFVRVTEGGVVTVLHFM